MEDRLLIDLERIEMEFRRFINDKIEIREMTVREIFELCVSYAIDL